MKAILRYLGAKNRIAPWVIDHFPDHRCYVEPYAGSLGVLLNKEPSSIEICNDLDEEVINLFRVLRSPRSNDLIEAIRLTPYSRSELRNSDPTGDDVERARRLLVRAWMGISVYCDCSSRSGVRVSAKRLPTCADDWERLPDILEQAVTRLKHVYFECRNALEVMIAHDSVKTLHYVDPPYLTNTRSATGKYKHEITMEDHSNLLILLKNLQGMVIVSGYDHELYNDQLKGWTKAQFRTFSNMGRPRTEILWMNFTPQMTLF